MYNFDQKVTKAKDIILIVFILNATANKHSFRISITITDNISISHQHLNNLSRIIQFLLPFYCLQYIRMSVNSTPRGYDTDTAFNFAPAEFLKTAMIQSSIPCLAVKAIGDIIQQYFKMKPQLIKKQNQIKGLFAFNEKMRQTIQSFIQHQRKVVRKYNKLCQIYAKHFKEYWNAKNVDVNFKDLIYPITSFSQTFSMNDWKVEIQQAPPLKTTPKYEEMLLNLFVKYYLNKNNKLEAILEKQLINYQKQRNSQPQNLSYIRQQIRELNTAIPTVHNMFDLLQKRKNIEEMIREIDDNYECQFMRKDLNFIDDVARIHAIITNPTAGKLREYLDHESQIRRSMKKKDKKFLQKLELKYQKIDLENSEIKQQIQQIKKKNQQLEQSRNDFRNKYQYLQLKAGVNKKDKDKNTSNTSIIQDPLSMGFSVKQTNKKMEIKISELENQIAQLKQQITEKQQTNKHLNVKKELMSSNSQIEELRLKLCSKLMQMGVGDTETMTSGQMFDRIMQKQFGIRNYEVKDPSSKDHQYIGIKITESVPVESNQKDLALKTPPQIEKESSMIDENQKSSYSFQRKSQQLQEDKDMIKSTELNQIRITVQEARVSPMYNPMTKSEPIVLNSEENIKESMNSSQRKKFSNLPLSSSALLSISQKKSQEEESKVQDVSKIFKENKSAIDERLVAKIEEQGKQIEEYMKNIKELENINQKLKKQQDNMKLDIIRLEKMLADNQNKPLSALEKIGKDLKSMENVQAYQIQRIFQDIFVEFQKLDASEYSKVSNSIKDLIQNIKSGSFDPSNINQIPILSKNLTQHEDNLFKSENLIAQIFGGKKPETINKKNSNAFDKSGKLSLKSGEIKLQIKQTKSIYFGSKDQSQNEELISPKKMMQHRATNINHSLDKNQEESIKIDQDELIDIVNDFQATSRRKKDQNNSQNSLRLSQSNLKNSRDSDIKSSLRIMDKVDRKLIQDMELLNKIQQKLEQIKNGNQHGSQLYWFYKRYRQAIEALENTETKFKEFQRKKDMCMDLMLKQDAELSKHKLQERVYFLQQKVKELEDRLAVNKEEYENNMAEHIKEIDGIKGNAIEHLLKVFFIDSNQARA